MGKLRNVIEPGQRREVIAAAAVILASLTASDQDAAVPTGRRLANLHIELFMVQRDFSTDGDAALIGAKIVGAGVEAQLDGELFEAFLAGLVKRAFLIGVVVA